MGEEKQAYLETRSVLLTRASVEKSDDDELPVIRSTAAVFEQLSDPIFSFREKIEKGAFARALKGGDTRALINHDSNLLMGRTKSKKLSNGKRTLELWEDEKGLQAENYPPDVEYARGLMELVKRGDLNQASIQFYVEKERWEGTLDEPIRVLEKINPLLDISYVTFPAYPQTSVDVRSMLGIMGVDMQEMRRVVAKGHRGLTLNDGERDTIKRAMEICERILVSDPDGSDSRDDVDDGGLLKVREHDMIRLRLRRMMTLLG